MQALSVGEKNVLPLGRKTRALLAILALSAPRAVSRMRLAELLWSRRLEEQARASLRQEIHRLLEALQPVGEVLRVSRDHVSLRSDLVWMDVEEVLQATVTNPAPLALLNGELLDEFNGLDPALDQWLTVEREKLRDHARIIAQALLTEQGAPDAVIPVAQQLLSIDRTHEGAWRALMRAHAERGERGLAIQAYERCRAALSECLDAAPSQETQRLVAEIRAGAASVGQKPSADLVKRSPSGRMGVAVGVLPLQNTGAGDDLNDLGHGFAEDLSEALSCFQFISVISSASTLQFSREEGASRRMAGLDFLLDGSMRHGATAARVTLRLVDLRDDNRIVWTNHFDLERQDRFELQDEIVAQVAARIQLTIERVEGARAARVPQEENTAYDLVLRAIPLVNRLIRNDLDEAEALLRRAIAIQPDYVPAQTHLAYLLSFRAGQGWSDNEAATIAEATRLADRSIMLDPRLARAFAVAGHIRGCFGRYPREALVLHARALSLNPNMAMVWGLAAMTYTYLGEFDEACIHFKRYRRLAPDDATAFFYKGGMVMLELQRRDYVAAIRYGREMNAMNPNLISGLQYYLAALGHAGLSEETTRVRVQLLNLAPRLTLQMASNRCALDQPAERNHYIEGLRKAGLRSAA